MPKQSAIFDSIAKDINPENVKTLKLLCHTRWAVRNKLLRTIIQNYYDMIDQVLKEISEERSEPGRKSNGLQAVMQQFSTYFGLYLSLDLFATTEQCSKELQRATISAGETMQIISILKETL